MNLKKIKYDQLNSRQKENYNFHKIASVLADYGFTSIRLSDDWQGADFIAVHIDGETDLKIQLKSRLVFSQKYIGKDLYICFPNNNQWYLYPHDELLQIIRNETNIENTDSWKTRGLYSFNSFSERITTILSRYSL